MNSLTTVPRDERVALDAHKDILGGYVLTPATLDELPLLTFLIRTISPTTVNTMYSAARLVKPRIWNKPEYRGRLTPGKRLLYRFWFVEKGSIKTLFSMQTKYPNNRRRFRYVIQPGDPGYELLDAFKILCDHRRGHLVSTTLLYRALALEDRHNEPTD